MSPYKSDKQRAWMHANLPDVAAKWDAEEEAGKHDRKRSKRSKKRKKKRGVKKEED